MADGLATDDVDVTVSCQVIFSAVNCQNRRKNCLSKSVLVCGLYCQCKQLQTSLATTMGPPRSVRTIKEIAHSLASALFVVLLLRCKRSITRSFTRSVGLSLLQAWNSLLTEFRSLSISFGDFRCTLKTVLFARY